MKDQVLQFHNSRRASLGVGPLTWSDDVANYVKNFLDSSNCEYGYSDGPYRELISGGRTPEAALNRWYSLPSGAVMTAGNTIAVGCAVRECPNYTFFVCDYVVVR